MIRFTKYPWLKVTAAAVIAAFLHINIFQAVDGGVADCLRKGSFLRQAKDHKNFQHSELAKNIIQMTADEIMEGLPGDIYRHSLRNARIAVRIARELGLTEEDIDLLQHAVWAHDLGQARNLEYPETLHFIKKELQRLPKGDRVESVRAYLQRWLDEAASKYGISPEKIERVRGLVRESGDYYPVWEMYMIYAVLGGEEKIRGFIEHGIVSQEGFEVISRNLYSHGMGSVEKLRERNILSSRELDLLVMYHHDYSQFDAELSEMVKRRELTEKRADSLRLLESIIVVSDSFEQGNNYERLVENRRLALVETFGETINGWIRKRFDEMEHIGERRPLEALKVLIGRRDAELFEVIADARQIMELMLGDIEFINMQSRKLPDAVKEQQDGKVFSRDLVESL